MPLLVLSSMSPLIYGWYKKIFLRVAYFIYTYIFTSVFPKRRPCGIVALFWNLLNLDPVRSPLLVQNLKSFINYIFVLNSPLKTRNTHVFYLLSYTMFWGNIMNIKKLLWKVFNGNVYFEVLKTQKVSLKKSVYRYFIVCPWLALKLLTVNVTIFCEPVFKF